MKTLYHHSKEINEQFESMINAIHLQVLQVNVSITEGKTLKQQFIIMNMGFEHRLNNVCDRSID